MATDTALPLHANLSTRDADHGYNPAFVDMTPASSALPADEFLTNLGDCDLAFAESVGADLQHRGGGGKRAP